MAFQGRLSHARKAMSTTTSTRKATMSLETCKIALHIHVRGSGENDLNSRGLNKRSDERKHMYTASSFAFVFVVIFAVTVFR